MTRRRLVLSVNGGDHEVWVLPSDTLLDVLHDELGLPDVRYGCGEGVCGTCTVLLDGEPVNALPVLAVQADGPAGHYAARADGPGRDAAPAAGMLPATAAPRSAGSAPPGMVLTALDLVRRRGRPSRERDPVRAGRQPVPLHRLHQDRRCGRGLRRPGGRSGARLRSGHDHRRPAARGRTALTGRPNRVVGQSLAHHDFVDKVRGTLLYADGLEAAGHAARQARPQRSCPPRASPASTSARPARSPASRAVLTADDVPQQRDRRRTPAAAWRARPVEQPVLAFDRVRYLGEPVALVAAETRRPRTRRPSWSRSTTRRCQACSTPRPRCADEAPRGARRAATCWSTGSSGCGDVDAALAAADVVIEDDVPDVSTSSTPTSSPRPASAGSRTTAC